MNQKDLFHLKKGDKLIYNGISGVTFQGFDINYNVIITDKNNNEKVILQAIFLRYAKIDDTIINQS